MNTYQTGNNRLQNVTFSYSGHVFTCTNQHDHANFVNKTAPDYDLTLFFKVFVEILLNFLNYIHCFQ